MINAQPHSMAQFAAQPSALVTLEPFYPLLMVEDDEVDIINAKRALRRHHVANPLVVANNGVEALNMLSGAHGYEKLDPAPKIILLDINMPKMNGIEFLQIIRTHQQLKSCKVFMLTVSDDQRDKLAAYNLDVAGYIIKPANYDRLLKVINLIHPLQYERGF